MIELLEKKSESTGEPNQGKAAKNRKKRESLPEDHPTEGGSDPPNREKKVTTTPEKSLQSAYPEGKYGKRKKNGTGPRRGSGESFHSYGLPRIEGGLQLTGKKGKKNDGRGRKKT